MLRRRLMVKIEIVPTNECWAPRVTNSGYLYLRKLGNRGAAESRAETAFKISGLTTSVASVGVANACGDRNSPGNRNSLRPIPIHLDASTGTPVQAYW